MLNVIALSGPICAGKTTLASGLCTDERWVHVKTRVELERLAYNAVTRAQLQKFGRVLDEVRRFAGREARHTTVII